MFDVYGRQRWQIILLNKTSITLNDLNNIMIMNKKYNQNVSNENVRFVILKINEQRNLILYFDFELIKIILLV